jgi:hypothetical protein
MTAWRSLNLLGLMHNKFSFATLPIHNSVMNNVSEEGIEMGEQTAIPSAMA